MSDRYASRNKGQYGYSGYSNNRSYNKDSSSRGGYGRPSPLSSSLSAPPRKKASVRPAPLPSLKSENADAVNILSSSGWGQKKSEDKASKRGEDAPIDGLLPWTRRRGVPGLNQPDKAPKQEESKLKRPSNPAQAAMLPSYMKPPPGENRENNQVSQPVQKHDEMKGDAHRVEPARRPFRRRSPDQRERTSPTKRRPVRDRDSPQSSEKENVELESEMDKPADNLQEINWAEDDKLDSTASWADDRPVKWDEKIDFSDEDQDKNRAEVKPSQSSGPGRGARQQQEADSTDRYDIRNEDDRYNARHDRGHNNYENGSRSNAYRPRYGSGRPIHRGFYDDHKRGIYESELESRGGDPRQNSKPQHSARRDIFEREEPPRPTPVNPRRNRKGSDNVGNRQQTSESSDHNIDLENIELQETEPVQMAKKRIIKVKKEAKIRDFTNEEKGEDDQKDKVEEEFEKEEKSKHIRGWKKGDNPEDERAQFKPRSGNSNQKGQLPTADGSKQSRLEKTNAEKEQKSNANVWEKRQKEIIKRLDNKRDDSQDSKSKEVYIPSENDRKKTLGETNPNAERKKDEQRGNSRRDDSDRRRERDDRPNRREKRENRREREPREGKHQRDRSDKNEGHSSRGERPEKGQRHREEKPESGPREKPKRGENSRSKPEKNAKADVAPKEEKQEAKIVKIEPAPAPKENVWAKRIETRQQLPKDEHIKDETQVKEQAPKGIKSRESREDRRERERDNREHNREHRNDHHREQKERHDRHKERGDRRDRDRSDRDRVPSKDHHGRKGQKMSEESSGSHKQRLHSNDNPLQNFRERGNRKNPHQSSENDHKSNRNERRTERRGEARKARPEKKQKKFDSSSKDGDASSVNEHSAKHSDRSVRLYSHDDDNMPQKARDRREPKERHDRHERDGQTAGRAKRGGATRATDRKNTRRDKKNPTSSKFRSSDFRTAYEFPKPSSDIKEVETQHVEAIRGGMSFRGLMAKKRAGSTAAMRGSRQSKSEDYSEEPDESESIQTSNEQSMQNSSEIEDVEEITEKMENVEVEKVEEEIFKETINDRRSEVEFPDKDPNLGPQSLNFITPEEEESKPVPIAAEIPLVQTPVQAVVRAAPQAQQQPIHPRGLQPVQPAIINRQHFPHDPHELIPAQKQEVLVGGPHESAKWKTVHSAWISAERNIPNPMGSATWQAPAQQPIWNGPDWGQNREGGSWKSPTKQENIGVVTSQTQEQAINQQQAVPQVIPTSSMAQPIASMQNSQMPNFQANVTRQQPNPYTQGIENNIGSFNANANLMTNSTNPLAANYNQALISNPSNFTNYAQQPAMYAQNQLQIAQASAQALQANCFFPNDTNALYNSPSTSSSFDLYQGTGRSEAMFPDPSSSLGNQIFNPNNFQDYTNVMGIQRPPSNNAMQNIFSQPMGPTGYRTSGFSGLINQQTRQNGLPSFPQMQGFGKSTSPSPGLAKNIIPPNAGGFEQMHPNAFGQLSQVLQFRERNRPTSITPPHHQNRHKTKDFNGGYPNPQGFTNGFEQKDSLKHHQHQQQANQQQQFAGFDDKNQLNQHFLRQGMDTGFKQPSFQNFNGQGFHHQHRPQGKRMMQQQQFGNPFEKKSVIGNEMLKQPMQKGLGTTAHLQGANGQARGNGKAIPAQNNPSKMGNMENYKQTMAEERQKLLALTKNFGVDENGARQNGHEGMPAPKPNEQGSNGAPIVENEQSPETIVSLTSTDRKRLTLADTAPKRPGEVRRIITNPS